MSVVNSTILNSHSLAVAGTGVVYIPTAVIFYEYTVFVYSSYQSFYISFFTIYYPSESNPGSNTTIIASVCAAIAAIIIIDSEKMTSFTSGHKISDVEEDLFAEDFKESRILEQILYW